MGEANIVGAIDTTEAIDAIKAIIERACRAPSVHNSQPWTWRIRGMRVDMYADYSRQLWHADPERRDLMISCGAALHHFQVAAHALGWAVRVRRAPDPDEQRLIATISLMPGHEPDDAAEILGAIAHRRTDRRRLTSWPVPPSRLVRLAAVGNQWGARVIPEYGDIGKARLIRLTMRADELQRADPGYLTELNTWTTYWDNHAVPVAHIPREATVDSPDSVNRRFPHGVLDDPPTGPEPSADGLLLITTSSDDAVSRIRAGEALSAMWLQATLDGLCMVPLSQALEVEETRRALQYDVLDDLAFAQLIVRVGWRSPGRPDLTPTPRRHVDDVTTHG